MDSAALETELDEMGDGDEIEDIGLAEPVDVEAEAAVFDEDDTAAIESPPEGLLNAMDGEVAAEEVGEIKDVADVRIDEAADVGEIVDCVKGEVV